MTDTPAVNIASHLADMARSQPDTLAVIIQKGRLLTDGCVYTAYTFSELNCETDRVALGLEAIGIGPGTRTALMVKPSLEFFTLAFGLFKIGAVPVLIDPGIGLKNLKTCLGEAKPEAFIGIPKAHVARLLFGWARESIRVKVTVGPRLFWGGTSLAWIGGEGEKIPATPKEGEPAAILFTSGSTGVPKGVVYTHRIFGDQIECLREIYGIEPGERDVATFPLFALFGPALGMTAIIPDMDATRPARANPLKIIAAVKDYEATNMFGSPALLKRVGRWGANHKTKLPSLRRILSAGAPAEPETLRQFSKMLRPGVQIFTPYGATESLPVSSIGSEEILNETAAKSAKGEGVCVGLPAPRAEVAIVPICDELIERWSEDLRLPQGEIGEIVVRGPRVTAEYFNRPEPTRLAKIPDPEGCKGRGRNGHEQDAHVTIHEQDAHATAGGGFFHRMGDVGYFDAHGRLWFCGRMAHRVVVGGETLHTIPCERIFNTHPQVARTALVGVERGGDTQPVLCVELERPGAWSKTALRQVGKELLEIGAANPLTRRVKTVLFHPAFPVDIRHNAKIFREKLAVWADKKLGSSS